MKHIFLLLLFILNAMLQQAQTFSPSTKLEVDWRFKDATKELWFPAQVPGCVHTDLIRNSVIEHPFYGTNEGACQWVGEADWVYETLPFDLPKEQVKKEVVRLRFNGLDTYADVYLNNVLLLKADNAFRYWEVDVKKILKEKNNVLRIQFYSPLPIAQKKLQELPYPLPYESTRAVARKPQFHYGWDWGPKLITCGISKDIELVAYDLARFEDIYVEQLRITEEKAKLKTRFTIHAAKEGMYSILFESIRTGENWTTDMKLKKGMNLIELPFEIEAPYRWWSNGLGNANLYNFNIILTHGDELVESKTIQTGLRDIKLITQKDSIGESFYFR